jgi:hypothetical protein
MISQFTCHSHLIGVLPLSAHELDFLERLNSAGDIVPDLLTEDAAMQASSEIIPASDGRRSA